MKEIEHIWEKSSIRTKVRPDSKHERSRFELVKTLRILYAEILVGVPIVFCIIWFRNSIQEHLWVLCLVTAGISIGLNLYAVVSLKRIDVSDNTNAFLKRTIKFLVAYAYRVVIVTFLVLVAFYLFLMESDQYGDKHFLFSYFILSLCILATVITYVLLVYVGRIRKLRKFVLEMN